MRNKKSRHSRRSFLNKLVISSAFVAGAPAILPAADKSRLRRNLPLRKISANDTLQIALIGTGGMGSEDTKTALKIPGTKLIAASYVGLIEITIGIEFTARCSH